MSSIPSLSLDNLNRSHTADLKKGVRTVQSESSYGFQQGSDLNYEQIMQNKLLGATFGDLETMQFIHRFMNVST
jgi:hypothetical protein